MAATIYYDNDADLSLLKNKTIAILGYGSQGHAQAQNLKDSGLNVVIGQRKGSANYDLAVEHGFEPMSLADATKAGDLVNILLPDGTYRPGQTVLVWFLHDRTPIGKRLLDWLSRNLQMLAMLR